MAHRNEDRGGISYAPGHQMPNFGPDRQRTSRRMDPDRITAEGLELLKFPRRLALVAERHLAATRRDDSDVYNVELATLQRMVIHDLQRQLLQLVGRIHDEQTADAQKMEDAKKLLEDYSTAIRNYDLMFEKKEDASTPGGVDPFLITSQDRLGFILFKQQGTFHGIHKTDRSGNSISAEDLCRTKIEDAENWDDGVNILPGMSRYEIGDFIKTRKFLERLSLGIIGGMAIIVPMLVMALVNNFITSLVVTSVATILFAIVLALPPLGSFGSDLDGQTVLGAVAAYAAILVVFVGTSMSATPS